MKKQIDKTSLLYGFGGGIVGSTVVASLVVVSLQGPAATNIVTLTAGLGGGIISGALTLLGVNRTINLQKEKERLDNIPQRIKGLMEIQGVLKKWNLDAKIKFIISIKKDTIPVGSLRIEYVSQLKKTIIPLGKSLYPKYLEVDGIIYTKIKVFLEYLETWVEQVLDFEENEDIPLVNIENFYGGKIKELENCYETLTEVLEDSLKKYENILFKHYK
ncbi:hypothetical protein [Bacillus mycoides]|uniref:hypothetical protein n=1 Tax=Bacillus mycoides TaxID=1405 RepID=UPI001C00FB03|nr:hypothetical protein [Bacillus mycoides]QWH09828.1 hypothetical protein EXW49_29595 [Bacillus mycoides]